MSKGVGRLILLGAGAFLMISCQTLTDASSKSVALLTYVGSTIEPHDERYRKLTGEFSLSNSGREDLCLHEDIFVNELSPHFSVSSDGQPQSGGIAHPPVTSEVFRLAAGGTRNFSRVIDYVEGAERANGWYKAKAYIWTCDSNKRADQSLSFAVALN